MGFAVNYVSKRTDLEIKKRKLNLSEPTITETPKEFLARKKAEGKYIECRHYKGCFSLECCKNEREKYNEEIMRCLCGNYPARMQMFLDRLGICENCLEEHWRKNGRSED